MTEAFRCTCETIKENQGILILEGLSSHKTIEAILFCCKRPWCHHDCSSCRYNPQASSPRCHFLGGPLKTNYNREYEKWMLCNAGKRIGNYKTAGLFGSAYIQTYTMSRAVNMALKLLPIQPGCINGR